MCYLVAKDRYAHGCFALKTTHGKHLAELKRELNRVVGYKGVQLVTISRPTAYGEYAPYHFVDTEQEFQTLVKGLRSQRHPVPVPGKNRHWYYGCLLATDPEKNRQPCLYCERNKHNCLMVRHKKSHSAVCDWWEICLGFE